MSTLLRILACSSVIWLQACAYRVPEPVAPATIPAVASADVRGAVVEVSDSSKQLDAKDVLQMKQDAAVLLDGALRDGGHEGATRVRIEVDVVEHQNHAENALAQDGFAIFGLWPALFGMVVDEATVTADVTIDHGGQSLRGSGKANRRGSLIAHARKRALAVAIDQALANARPEPTFAN
jgi:hypothetical protein